MTTRIAVKLLLGLVLGLPILQAVFSWVVGLLSAMGDGAAADVLGYVNTSTRIAWLVCVVGLIIMLAFQSLHESRDLDS